MSYFHRIATRTLGTDEQKVIPAVTSEQIPEIFETKSKEKHTPKKIGRKSIALEPQSSDLEENPKESIKVELPEIQSEENPKESIKVELPEIQSEEPLHRKINSSHSKKNKKDKEKLEVEDTLPKELIISKEKNKPDIESAFVMDNTQNLHEDNMEPQESLNEKPKMSQSDVSKQVADNNNAQMPDQKNFTTKIPLSQSNIDTSISEAQNVSEENILIAKNKIKNVVNDSSLQEDSFKDRETKKEVNQKTNLSIRHDKEPIKFPTIIPREYERTPNQEQPNPTHETTVTINIGRIEVRASTQNSQIKKQQTKFAPPLSLAEYLKRQKGNR